MFTLRHRKGLPVCETVDGITVHRVLNDFTYSTRSPCHVLKYSVGVALRVANTDFDVYYSGGWPLVHSLFLNQVVDPLIQEWAIVLGKKMLPLEKLIGAAIQRHVVVSNGTRERLIEKVGVPHTRITLIPNGINPDNYQKAEAMKDPTQILFLGRLVPHKRVDIVLKAFEVIKQEIPDAKLYVAGKGPLLPRIQKEYSDHKDVMVTGAISEKRKLELLQSSGLFFFPSEREGFGITALEALAAGTPCIIGDFPQNAARKEFSKGIIVAKPDYNDFADTALSLLQNYELWKTYSDAAREEARKYEWDNIAKNLENYFYSVVK